MDQVGIEFIFSAAKAINGVVDLTKRMFAMNTAQNLVNKGFNMLFNTMPAIQQTIQQMENVITHNLVYPLQQQVVPVLQSMMKWVQENRVNFVQLGKVIANIFVALLESVKIVFGAISKLFNRIVDTVFGKSRTAFQVLIDFLNLVTLKIAFIVTFMALTIETALDYIGDKFTTVFNEVILPLWNTFGKTIKYVSALLEDPKKAIKEFDASIQALALGGMVLLANSIISVSKALMARLIVSLTGATAAMWSFTVALLANPLTWWVVGITLLGYALIKLYQNFDDVSASVDGFISRFSSMDAIIETAKELYGWISKVGNSISSNLGEFFSGEGFKINQEVTIKEPKKEEKQKEQDYTTRSPIEHNALIRASGIQPTMPNTNTYNDNRNVKFEINNPDPKQVVAEIRKKMEEENTLKKQYNKTALMQGI